jgi:tetratricopeptide (TPR) repeat protein
MDPNKNPKSRQFANMAKASGQWAKRNRRPLAWIGGGILVVGVLALASMKFHPHAPGSKASLADATKRAKREPKAWQAQRDLGHSQFAAGQHAQALKSYERALKLNAEAADGRMVDNLAKCYRTPEQAEAESLIVQYKMDAAKDLEGLSRDKAYATRWAALDTLDKLGKVKRADLLQAWHRDLEDPAATCDARRRAVEMIGDYDSGKDVVAQLRAAKKKDQAQTPWYKRSCLGSRTDDAEKKILARSPATKHTQVTQPTKNVLARR